MKYHIVTAPNVSRLMTKVTEFLREGWVPQGGHMAVQIKDAGSMRISYEFSQAVILPHPNTN